MCAGEKRLRRVGTIEIAIDKKIREHHEWRPLQTRSLASGTPRVSNFLQTKTIRRRRAVKLVSAPADPDPPRVRLGHNLQQQTIALGIPFYRYKVRVYRTAGTRKMFKRRSCENRYTRGKLEIALYKPSASRNLIKFFTQFYLPVLSSSLSLTPCADTSASRILDLLSYLIPHYLHHAFPRCYSSRPCLCQRC